ncbi:FMN reductase [Leptobacterium flavescens]|uniref:FMN reductase n=1 Tax=Leptobacterium flavescens TaxID=472055 RepID=A0A6P0ULX1_9FLAO|nr:flavodoxin family protein [Leptobacterium flavescens]NER14341.1 FMN reductase [Leptobacterium flavescens]
MAKGVIIQASSRSNGNTAKIVSLLQEHTSFDIIDLNEKKINHFDYELKNEDDFNGLFKEIVNNYQTIVFATPVYWYSMSGLLKVFLDRISDFLFEEKETGRKLRGMNMALISCGSDKEAIASFNRPFTESANYLGMNYLGDVHSWVEENGIPEEVKLKLIGFSEQLQLNDTLI